MSCADCTRSPNGGKACRGWVNCPTYNNKQRQLQRLKMKEMNNEIQEWYADNFKIEFLMGSSVPNG